MNKDLLFSKSFSNNNVGVVTPVFESHTTPPPPPFKKFRYGEEFEEHEKREEMRKVVEEGLLTMSPSDVLLFYRR